MATGDDSRKPEAQERETQVPLARLIACIAIFWAWSAAVSVIHSLFTNFDLTSVVVAEVAMAPILLLVARQLSFTWGDKSATFIPAPIGLGKVEHVFEQTRSFVVASNANTGAFELETLQNRLGTGTTSTADEETQTKTNFFDEAAIARSEDSSVLVNLAFELEKRVIRLGKTFGVSLTPDTSVLHVLERLYEKGIINHETMAGIRMFMSLGRAQLHGSRVEPLAADFVRNEAEPLLSALDRLPEGKVRGIEAEVTRSALEHGLTVNREQNVDLLVNDSVAFEVKSASNPVSKELAVRQIQSVIGKDPKLKGIVLFAAYDDASKSQLQDGLIELDERVGLAWRTKHGFRGNQTAMEIAPWLFGAPGSK
jgi:hypothetical protein